jgi:hypothetical protein
MPIPTHNQVMEPALRLQVEQTIEIKKMDSDFWDSMQDK